MSGDSRVRSMSALPHPLLVADIGGTNCRVGIVEAEGSTPRRLARVATREARSPTEALGGVIAAAGIRPRAAAIAVAGPLVGDSANLTNADWRLHGPTLARELGLETGVLVNDFEALALSLSVLGPADVAPVGRAAAGGAGARLILGPGTGFGASALLGRPGRWTVAASEAGHVELGPLTEDEARIWPHMERFHGRMTVEGVLSGDGLARIDAAMRAAGGGERRHRDGAAVHAAALAGDAAARAAIRMLGRLLARVAGDIALTMKALGGVHIAGGIAPKLMPLFDQDEMREAFEAKAPMRPLMERTALVVVTAPDPAERGLAALALDPASFGFDDRLWR